MLNSEEIKGFEKRLQEERDRIQARIAANDQGVMETVRGEEGVGDSVDDADLTYEREVELGEDDRDRRELSQVQKALDRIKEGTYGVSELSGKPIPRERLEANPSATTLVSEQQAID
jgi:RNA polymerase-binding protein DksA